MTATRWQTSSTTLISWVMITTVIPISWFNRLSSARIDAVVCGSSAEVASSQRSTFGFVASARAIATRCF